MLDTYVEYVDVKHVHNLTALEDPDGTGPIVPMYKIQLFQQALAVGIQTLAAA